MSAPMHTPGPWGIEGNIEVWIKAGHLHVATIPRAHDGDWSEANARLIAAAPTMADYIAKKAAEGDPEAIQIMEAIYGDA